MDGSLFESVLERAKSNKDGSCFVPNFVNLRDSDAIRVTPSRVTDEIK